MCVGVALGSPPLAATGTNITTPLCQHIKFLCETLLLPTIESATYDGCERRLSSGCTQREDASYWDLLPPELRFEILRTASAATSSPAFRTFISPYQSYRMSYRHRLCMSQRRNCRISRQLSVFLQPGLSKENSSGTVKCVTRCYQGCSEPRAVVSWHFLVIQQPAFNIRHRTHLQIRQRQPSRFHVQSAPTTLTTGTVTGEVGTRFRSFCRTLIMSRVAAVRAAGVRPCVTDHRGVLSTPQRTSHGGPSTVTGTQRVFLP